MRFKFIAIIALLVMISGVIGILTKGFDNRTEENIKDGPLKYSATYYTSNKELFLGDIITRGDITERTAEYIAGGEPEWLETAINESILKEIMDSGGIATTKMSSGHIMRKTDISMMSMQLREDYVVIPISVLASSLNNPDIPEKGFIDLYLLSNDNQVYRDNYFNEKNKMGKEYKDTRVKLFANKVFYIKNFDEANKFYKALSGGVFNIKSKTPDDESYSENLGKNDSNMSVIYAYFKNEDLSKVIQAQVLGVFVASPGKVKNLSDGFSMIALNSWEVTASDIVSGAPSPNDRNQILELRGAK